MLLTTSRSNSFLSATLLSFLSNVYVFDGEGDGNRDTFDATGSLPKAVLPSGKEWADLFAAFVDECPNNES